MRRKSSSTEGTKSALLCNSFVCDQSWQSLRCTIPLRGKLWRERRRSDADQGWWRNTRSNRRWRRCVEGHLLTGRSRQCLTKCRSYRREQKRMETEERNRICMRWRGVVLLVVRRSFFRVVFCILKQTLFLIFVWNRENIQKEREEQNRDDNSISMSKNVLLVKQKFQFWEQQKNKG